MKKLILLPVCVIVLVFVHAALAATEWEEVEEKRFSGFAGKVFKGPDSYAFEFSDEGIERQSAVSVDSMAPSTMESIEKVVNPVDGRKKVEEPYVWPWCAHGQLIMKYEKGFYVGSGTIIGPHTVITAAHNVWGSDADPRYDLGHVKSVRYCPGLSADRFDGIALSVKWFVVCSAYVEGKSMDHDMAILGFSDQVADRWFRLRVMADSDLMSSLISVTGYPGDKRDDGTRFRYGQYTMEGVPLLKDGIPHRIFYPIDTFYGNSGSGIWTIGKDGQYYCVAVHTTGPVEVPHHNAGVRITERKKSLIDIWTDWIIPRRDPGSLLGASLFPMVGSDFSTDHERFLAGKLLYRPNFLLKTPREDRDVGMIEVPFRSLEDPLNGTFDLSDFGETGKYLSIHTGYKKGKIPGNEGKLEIWIMPMFLVEEDLGTTAWYLRPIMSEWKDSSKIPSPYGLLFTKGDWEVGDDNYGYSVKAEGLIKSPGFFVKYAGKWGGSTYRRSTSSPLYKSGFLGFFESLKSLGLMDAVRLVHQFDVNMEVKFESLDPLHQEAWAFSRLDVLPPLFDVPPIARGHEAEYARFLSGTLVYKPAPDGNTGRIEIPISSLDNPLDGTFDLPGVRGVTIRTGYQKGKVEGAMRQVWITPRFLVEKELSSTASYLEGIMSEWESPVGLFWTIGGNYVDAMGFRYLVSGETLRTPNKSFSEKNREGSVKNFYPPGAPDHAMPKFPSVSEEAHIYII